MYPTVTPINALRESDDVSSFCNSAGSSTFLWGSGIVMAFLGEGSGRIRALQVSGVADTDGDTHTGSIPESLAERHSHAGA
jgi:hypothetical protein